MNRYIYVITNINKLDFFHAGLSRDILKTLAFYKGLPDLFVNTDKGPLNSLVYFEELHDEEVAMERFKAVSAMPQKEKREMIEKQNPDYIEITEDMLKQHLKNPNFI